MIWENIKGAITSVRSARFRSFLTMLGVIIGVISVITTVSLGEGIKRQVIGQSNSVGKDLITVRPGKLVKRDNEGKVSGINLLSFLTSSQISEKDLKTISDNPAVATAVPFSVISGTPAIDKKNFDEGFIIATTDKMTEVVGQKVEFGNFFDGTDTTRKVAVIGAGVAEKLFEENVPIGKTFQIRGQDFVVSGVFEHIRSNPVSPEADFNNGIFIPYETGKALTGNDLKMYELLVRPKDKSVANSDPVIASITNGVKQNHAGQEDFTVLRQDDLVSIADNLLGLITTTITIMAAVALIVGGIGIMNVTLVSVTERTREIGIRKAVGATDRQIQTQFLTEAVVLSVWGAIIGIFLSVIINLMFRIFTNLEPIITWQVVAVSGGVAVLVGVIFGLIPAAKAARKDPIEALRTM